MTLLTEDFIEARPPKSAKETARALQVSESACRRALESLYIECRLDQRKDSRPTYSRDYPMMETGSCLVSVYSPSKGELRNVIIQLRKLAEPTPEFKP